MSRLPPITAREMARVLLRAGFTAEPETGSSHQGFWNAETGKRTTVPRHAGDLKRGTMRAILRQAGLSREKFLRLLRE